MKGKHVVIVATGVVTTADVHEELSTVRTLSFEGLHKGRVFWPFGRNQCKRPRPEKKSHHRTSH
jgi:hypothetical protein